MAKPRLDGTMVVSVRLQSDLIERIDRGAVEADLSRSQWITAAILAALDQQYPPHVPQAVIETIPVQTRRGLRLPSNRSYDRF